LPLAETMTLPATSAATVMLLFDMPLRVADPAGGRTRSLARSDKFVGRVTINSRRLPARTPSQWTAR
jgi:hypothetical protein